MPYSPEQIHELDVLIRYNLESSQQGIKVHKNATPETIENTLNQGMQFLNGVFSMATGQQLVTEEQAITVNRETGEVSYGRIPPGSVVVSGNLPSANKEYSLYCAVIVKQVDAKTRSKTGINELLRGI